MFAAPTLTQIVLNPAHPTAQRDLGDVHRMHQRVMHLCSPDNFGEHSRCAAGVLHRVDYGIGNATLLVQSLSTPNPSVLPAGYGHAATRNMGPLLDKLSPGVQVRYRIAASPYRQVGGSKQHGIRGKRHPLHGDDALQWWHRKAPDCGLDLEDAQITDDSFVSGKKGESRIVHPRVQFDGTATVNDTEVLRQAIMSGVGRGRPYGMGMISLAIAN